MRSARPLGLEIGTKVFETTGQTDARSASLQVDRRNKMRKSIIAGNWKMYKTVPEALALVEGLKKDLAQYKDADVVVCPTFTALYAVKEALKGTNIALGAQNAHWEKQGAYTGEISVEMLKDVGCRYVILGHSERRQYFHETDAAVNKKAKAVLAAGLRPIICVGETLAQRQAGQTNAVVEEQIRGCLAGLTGEQLVESVIAYEPVWAIGTGLNATPAQAQEVHALIRRLLKELVGAETAAKVRLQYGGSMKPANAKELLAQEDIDGGLIGGASLEAQSFVDIVRAAKH